MERNDFAKGALLGVVAGAVAGVLFAPKAGEETREDIKKTFTEIKEKVTDKLHYLEDFTKEKYDSVVSSVVGGYEEAKKVTPTDAKKIKVIFDESYSKIEEIMKEDAKKIKDSAKDKK